MLHETPGSTPQQLELTTDLPGVEPDVVLRYFTDADLVKEWWAPESEIDLDGATYTHRWPETGLTVGGRILEHRPGELLAFSWESEHELNEPERTVVVSVAPHEGGTRLTIRHGEYGPTDGEAEEREGHLDGWEHYLPQLAEALGVGEPGPDLPGT